MKEICSTPLLRGLAKNANYMYCAFRNTVVLLFVYGGMLHTTEQLTLSHISLEQCAAKASVLAKKIERHRILNACIAAAATVSTGYIIWNFLTGDGVSVQKSSEKIAWSWDTFRGSALDFLKLGAKHICVRWVIDTVMLDFSVKKFIKEYVSYHEHVRELQIILKHAAQTGTYFRNERDAYLVKMHLQKMLDKLGCVLVYLLAQSDKNSLVPNTIDEFVQLTIQVVEQEVALFHSYTKDNQVVLCQKLCDSVTGLLSSSIKYLNCIMSDDLV